MPDPGSEAFAGRRKRLNHREKTLIQAEIFARIRANMR
jgi:hypothetical protein